MDEDEFSTSIALEIARRIRVRLTGYPCSVSVITIPRHIAGYQQFLKGVSVEYDGNFSWPGGYLFVIIVHDGYLVFEKAATRWSSGALASLQPCGVHRQRYMAIGSELTRCLDLVYDLCDPLALNEAVNMSLELVQMCIKHTAMANYVIRGDHRLVPGWCGQ